MCIFFTVYHMKKKKRQMYILFMGTTHNQEPVLGQTHIFDEKFISTSNLRGNCFSTTEKKKNEQKLMAKQFSMEKQLWTRIYFKTFLWVTDEESKLLFSKFFTNSFEICKDTS